MRREANNNLEEDFFKLLAIILAKDALEVIVGDFSPALVRKILLDRDLLNSLREKYFPALKVPTINSYQDFKRALKKLERELKKYFHAELEMKLDGENLYLRETKCPYGLESEFHLCPLLIFVFIFLGDAVRDLKIIVKDDRTLYHLIVTHTP